MNKKLIPLILALVCAIACAFGLAACGDGDDNEAIGLLVAKNGELPVEELNVNITYGEKPDLDYKLYLSYKNGDRKEVPFTDENLTVVEYVYSGSLIEKLPDEYLVGTYTIGYEYPVGKSNFRAYVSINVTRAGSGAFSVQSTKSAWYENEKAPNVILKNPKGLPVTVVTDRTDVNKSDDSDGTYWLYYIKKSVYDTFTEAQKTDYEFIQNYFDEDYKKDEHNIGHYLPDYEIPVGEYMLFAMIDETYNYASVVTPAVKITVKSAFIGRTFKLQSIALQDWDGNPVTDTENEYVAMAESFNTANQGKTVICMANGEVRGTVDFGAGAFDELTGNDVYTYNAFSDSLSIYSNTDGYEVFAGDGKISGNTFTLKMVLQTENGTYYWIITFTAQ